MKDNRDGTDHGPITVFAPAKINLTLHVTGQRDDGYHTLDSLVMFADIGDRIDVRQAAETRLTVTGPMADKTPDGADNLVLQAARLIGADADITLDKQLPVAAGIGGGSTDAAATLRALARLTGQDMPANVPDLGADALVCCAADHGAARMGGIGDIVTPVRGLPQLHAVMVNPNVPVITADVFARLKRRENAPMPDPLPQDCDAAALIDWLRVQRNDLQEPAMDGEPKIAQIFAALAVTPGCLLTRMSGSGATCFGLYGDSETAASAAGRLREDHASWWVTATRLNPGGAV